MSSGICSWRWRFSLFLRNGNEVTHRIIATTLVIIFLAWILPLGVFIAPSKEKMFCDGQRAICMCSHMAAKHKHTDSVETFAKAENSQKESHGFSSSHYDSIVAVNSHDTQAFLYCSLQQNFYKLLVSRAVEHVPKV